jgi:Zn-finger nucleic acid-binding protein
VQLLCLGCGGALGPEAARAAITCRYCGVTSAPPPEVVVVGRLKPMGIPANEPEETRLPCPRCADWLGEMNVHDTVLSTCRGCGGVWLDAATVNRLMQAPDHEIEAAAKRIAARLITGAPPDRHLGISCPVCRTHLRQVPIPRTSQRVDVCAAHGTWFDGDDADELQLFLRAFASRA